jgi:hypothetical protein
MSSIEDLLKRDDEEREKTVKTLQVSSNADIV